jgi:preprotein translocase subunit SecE
VNVLANKTNNNTANKDGAVISLYQRAKSYLTSVYNELKKVHWPGRTQLMAYTGVVLVSVVIVGFIIWLFDTGLGFLLEKLFNFFA